jgi:hypothetical protein
MTLDIIKKGKCVVRHIHEGGGIYHYNRIWPSVINMYYIIKDTTQ